MNSIDMASGQTMSIDSSTDNTSIEKLSQKEMEMEILDLPKYLLGKSYFDCKEYDRAAFVLTGCQSLKSKFLRLYSKFLVNRKNDC